MTVKLQNKKIVPNRSENIDGIGKLFDIQILCQTAILYVSFFLITLLGSLQYSPFFQIIIK